MLFLNTYIAPMPVHHSPDMNIIISFTLKALNHLHSLGNSSVLIARSSPLHTEGSAALTNLRPLGVSMRMPGPFIELGDEVEDAEDTPKPAGYSPMFVKPV